MLSRVANSIYWLARYIERAENVARSIDVNLQLQLDLPGEERPWEPVIQIAGNADDFFKKYAHVSIENALMFLTFDKENPNSIISCVGAARENARCVRERISSELWIAINQFYLKLNDPKMPKEALAGPHAFYNSVKEFSQLTAGIIQGTMNHDVTWNFTHKYKWKDFCRHEFLKDPALCQFMEVRLTITSGLSFMGKMLFPFRAQLCNHFVTTFQTMISMTVSVFFSHTVDVNKFVVLIQAITILYRPITFLHRYAEIHDVAKIGKICQSSKF